LTLVLRPGADKQHAIYERVDQAPPKSTSPRGLLRHLFPVKSPSRFRPPAMADCDKTREITCGYSEANRAVSTYPKTVVFRIDRAVSPAASLKRSQFSLQFPGRRPCFISVVYLQSVLRQRRCLEGSV